MHKKVRNGYQVINFRAVLCKGLHSAVSQILATTQVHILEGRASCEELLHREVGDATVPVELLLGLDGVRLPIRLRPGQRFDRAMIVLSEISLQPFKLSSSRPSGKIQHSKCSSVRGVNSKLRHLTLTPRASRCVNKCFRKRSKRHMLLLWLTRQHFMNFEVHRVEWR